MQQWVKNVCIMYHNYCRPCLRFSAYGLDPGFALSSLDSKGLRDYFPGKLKAEPRTALPGCVTELTCTDHTRSYRADGQASL